MSGPLPLELFRSPQSAGLPPYTGLKLGFTHAPDAFRVICSNAVEQRQPKIIVTDLKVVRLIRKSKYKKILNYSTK